MKWEKVKLSEVTEYITDGDHQPAPKSDSGVLFVKIKDIQDNRLTFDNALFVPQEYYNRLPKNRKAEYGDTLYTVVGSYGIPAFVNHNIPFCFERNIALLHPNNRVIPKYLYYAVKNPIFYGNANNIANGSAQKLIPLSKLAGMEISVPPIERQETIVNILSAYDDLIENNQKQIKLLEEAAQRLYKEWFVDLRFPGHENVKIVDGVPEGWKKVFLGGICTLKKDAVPAGRISTGTPYIGLEHMPRVDFCLSSWGSADDVISNKFRYAEDDIIFGKIRPYFHKVGFALNNGVVSTDSFVMKANDGIWGLLLMTVFDRAFVDYTYQTCKEGSKMPRADWNQMEKYPVLIPSEKIRQDFEKFIWNITRQVKTLALQNHALTEARDQLLPKLMSGEIEV